MIRFFSFTTRPFQRLAFVLPGLLFLLCTGNVNAQYLLQSISPDEAQPGQTLVTTITATGSFFNAATIQAPQIYLMPSATSFSNGIPATDVSLSSDSSAAYATFHIPVNTPADWYSVLAQIIGAGGVVVSQGYLQHAVKIGEFFIGGIVYNDLNANGSQNAGENGIANQQVLILPDSIYITTDADGRYKFYGTDSASYTVKWNPDTDFTQTSAPPSYTFTLNSFFNNANFGIHVNNNAIELHTGLVAFAPTCNQQRTASINLSNWGTVTADGSLIYVKPTNATYISAIPTPLSVNGDTLTWNYSDLTLGSSKTFNVKLQMPGAGQSLDHTVTAYGQNTSTNMYDTAVATLHQVTTCSYDPNDKTPNNDVIDSANTPIDYTIRFQNTGTDTAYQIIVTDTLSDLLDWDSFVLLATSHPVNVNQTTNGEFEFVFSAINLVDSNTNEPESHGYITFRVTPDSTIPSGTVIHNDASIYFDLNAPVLTNDAVVLFCEPVTTNQSVVLCNGDSVAVGTNWYSQSGTYTDTIITASGCDSIVVTQIAASSVSVSIDASGTTCGIDNGTVIATPTGTATPFLFSWSNGSTTGTVNGLTAGDYAVTVTDSNGCSVSDTAVIATSAAMTLELETEAATCSNANGLVDITVSGGTSPFTFNWSNGATTEDLNDVAAGVYSVTVTDSNSCTITGTDTVADAAGPQLSQTAVAASCGLSNGSIDLTVTDGTAPLSFTWSNAATTQNLTALSAGVYAVTVTDANGCVATTSVIVNGTPAVTITATPQGTTCGTDNGAISLTVNSGTSPYAFGWSNSSTTQNIANVAADDYTITVTDANNCSVAQTITVNGSTGVMVSLTPVNATCGNANGSIGTAVSGATSPYTFSWSNGATTDNISGLAAAAYTVTVTSANNCTATASATITTTQPPTLNTAADNASCGASNGGVDLTVSGAAGPYTYSWSNGSTTQDITDVGAGNYSVTVTAANGCSAVTTTSVSNTNGPSVSTVTSSSTCGQANGSVNLTVTGGSTPYSFAWSNGATVEDISGLAAGVYNVTVLDAADCVASATVTVTDVPGPSATLTATNATCENSNGNITTGITGGTAPFTFLWSNSATTQNLIDIAASVYTLTVTDENNCTAVFSKTVGGTPSPVVALSVADATCSQNNGAIAANASAGTGPFTYAWSNDSTTQTITSLAPGFYSVTVTDANGCTVAASDNIDTTPAPVITTLITGATCGLSNGAVTLTVTGAPSPYTFLWSNGATTQNLSNLSQGVYGVTVTADNGCTASTLSVVDGTPPVAFSFSINSASCGLSNGIVTITLNSGASPFTFEWTNGATTQNLINVPAGDYTVTVADVNGCTAVQTIAITDTPPPTLTVIATTATCSQNNGSVLLTVGGGVSPFTFEWSNNVTTQNLTNVSAGTYTVTVTDANDCTASQSAVVDNQLSPVVAFTATIASCGFNNGTIDLTASGNGPFTYLWSNGATVADITGLAAGTYTVTVTDVNGCTAVESILVGSNTPVVLSAVATDVGCGNTNGTIDLTVAGGSPPFTYLWSTGATTEDISDLGAGTYTVTVTGTAGCTASTSVSVNSLGGPVVSGVATQDICGLNSGAVDLTITAGTTPYTVLWSNGNTSQDVNGLTAGIYSVTVTDAAGCVDTESFNVTGTPPPVVAESNVIHPSCGLDNGFVFLTVAGGVSPYTFIWSDGSTMQDLTEAASGAYTVSIQDVNGCSSDTSFTLVAVPAPQITSTVVNTVCGDANGVINVTVTGGLPPFLYNWTNGATDEDLVGVFAGTYSVTVTDDNGCTTSSDIILGGTAGPALTVVATDVLCGGSDGAIDVTVTSGALPYTFNWNNGQTTEDLNNLPAGTYSVTMLDANFCTASAEITIGSGAGPSATYNSTPTTCGQSNGTVDVTVNSGTAPFTFLWSNGATFEDLINLGVGFYFFTVTDANGCISTNDVLIVSGNGSPDPSFTAVAASCGLANGSADLTVNGGIPPYTFQWSNGATTEDLNNVAAGTYLVTVSDVTSCQGATLVTIGGSSAPAVTATPHHTTCGLANGSVNATVFGGTPPYSFNWSNASTIEDLNSLMAGTLALTVTDANGCTASDTATVNSSVALSIGTINGNDTVQSNTDGTYFIGHIANANYVWSIGNGVIQSGQGTNQVVVMWTDSGTGFISVVITSDGCSASDTLPVEVDFPIGVQSIDASEIGMTLYPNPASAFSLLTVEALRSTAGFLRIYSDDGRLMRESAMNLTSGINRIAMDLSDFASGVYMVEIKSTLSHARLKMIVTK